jgi:aryl-alcohol dehydrogenase-like predicted oxidoreductase
MNLILGSAQFGSDYGVTNKTGQIQLNELEKILKYSKANNINTIDTASAYGDSEKNIGLFNKLNFKIISKLPLLELEIPEINNEINKIVSSSLNNLRTKSLDTLLLHSPRQMLTQAGDTIYESLISIKNRGLVNNIGISVYDTETLIDISKKYDFDVVQAPVNIFDRRFISDEITNILIKKNIKLHARSIFLQGILLNPLNLHNYFQKWEDTFYDYQEWLNEARLTPLNACIQFLLKNSNIDSILFGVDSLKQLKDIIESIDNDYNLTIPEFFFSDIDLINPTKWKI